MLPAAFPSAQLADVDFPVVSYAEELYEVTSQLSGTSAMTPEVAVAAGAVAVHAPPGLQKDWPTTEDIGIRRWPCRITTKTSACEDAGKLLTRIASIVIDAIGDDEHRFHGASGRELYAKTCSEELFNAPYDACTAHVLELNVCVFDKQDDPALVLAFRRALLIAEDAYHREHMQWGHALCLLARAIYACM